MASVDAAARLEFPRMPLAVAEPRSKTDGVGLFLDSKIGSELALLIGHPWLDCGGARAESRVLKRARF